LPSQYGDAELRYTNYVEFINGYGWISVDAQSDALAAGNDAEITVTASPALLEPGHYEAQIRIDGNQINPAQIVTVSLLVGGVDDPGESWARLDGYELVRPSWEAATGFDTVMVVYNGDRAPQEGVVYNAGDVWVRARFFI
jgi:hypothetical protein